MPIDGGRYRRPNEEEREAIAGLARVHAKVDVTEWTNDERGLLLYLESCAVDHGSCLAGMRMNGEDHAILKGWAEAGFVTYGRIPSEMLDPGRATGNTHWADLSETAWRKAHQLRRMRAKATGERAQAAGRRP